MGVFTLLTLVASILSLTTAQTNSSNTYTNPILPSVGADPWVVYNDGYYYMTYTTNTNITILRSSSLTDWADADAKLAFDPLVSIFPQGH